MAPGIFRRRLSSKSPWTWKEWPWSNLVLVLVRNEILWLPRPEKALLLLKCSRMVSFPWSFIAVENSTMKTPGNVRDEFVLPLTRSGCLKTWLMSLQLMRGNTKNNKTEAILNIFDWSSLVKVFGTGTEFTVVLFSDAFVLLIVDLMIAFYSIQFCVLFLWFDFLRTWRQLNLVIRTSDDIKFTRYLNKILLNRCILKNR